MPALNDDSIFAADKLSQFRDTPLYYGWLNAKTLFHIITHAPPAAPNPDAPTVMPQMQAGKIIDALGLAGMRSACFAYREDRAGSHVDFFVSAPEADRNESLSRARSSRCRPVMVSVARRPSTVPS